MGHRGDHGALPFAAFHGIPCPSRDRETKPCRLSAGKTARRANGFHAIRYDNGYNFGFMQSASPRLSPLTAADAAKFFPEALRFSGSATKPPPSNDRDKAMKSVLASFGESIPASRISGSASCLSNSHRPMGRQIPLKPNTPPLRTDGFPLRHVAANSIVR